ncbi:MAG: extracellular solute-binding protein, partial [Alphaproteobacteria bacterium]|nr:extracellular solute-binding protein [Alphaproteobacteria bacterium]
MAGCGALVEVVRAAATALVAVLAVLVAGAMPGRAAERVLNIYNWSDYIADETLAAFTRETGIRINYDVYDSNEILETKLTAGRSGYDLVVPTGSPFMARQIQAGLYQPLDRSRLKNWGNLDPEVMARLAVADPGNDHAVAWMWGTVGIGYNPEMVKAAMPDAPVDSLKILFDPDGLARFKSCGVMMLDSPTDVLPAVLKFLGRDPDSHDPADLALAIERMRALRPSVRKFHSSEYINALANGAVCVAYGWSGDVFQAASRAEEAGRGVRIAYAIPREGALFWV